MLAKVVLGVVGVAVILAGVYVFHLFMEVRASSSALPDVVIVCSGSTRIASPDACRAWGDAILAEGAPSHTFNIDDLARLELSRPLLGLAGACEAEWFLGRYPDDPAWGEEVACGDR